MRPKPKRGSARQIQRERLGMDYEPPSPMKLETPADILPEVIRKAGLENRAWEHELSSEWADIVGEQVAAHTRPGKHARKRLTVFVDSSPWLSALQMQFKPMMLNNLQQRFGKNKIADIFFCIDPDQ